MRASAVLDAVAAGWLTLHAGRSYALADAAKAQADLESRETEGKLLLLP